MNSETHLIRIYQQPVMSLLDQYRALRRSAGIVDRSDRGQLLLTGADRRSYLQGLLSNDIAALAPGSGCYAAYLTAQGRMIADMRVYELGDSLLVDLDGRLAQPVADRWSQFIFSEDVSVRNVSSQTAEVGVYGPRAAAVLAAALDPSRSGEASPPDETRLRSLAVHSNLRVDVRGSPITVLASDEIGLMGFDVVLPLERKEEIASLLRAAGAMDVPLAAAEIARIEAGRPRFFTDMHEDTIPLEAGIEDRAISLTKGCYVGQEIIIRVLHRGHGRVARKLVGLSFDNGIKVPEPGAPISSGSREIGSVTSATHSPELDRPIALGYVHRDFVEPGTPVEVAGVPAHIAALPFVPVTPLV
jgi:folate-binding protein YgfZ